MNSIFRTIKLFLLPCALVLVVASCSPDVDPGLNSAVSEVSAVKKADDIASLWAHSSKEFRHGNDDDVDSYVRYVKAHGFHVRQIKVSKVTQNGDVGLAVVKVWYSDSSGSPLGSAVEEWKFVREDGGWFLDGYQTLSEQAN